MASRYVISFRFLDQSPEIQRGRVALRVDPEGPAEYVMPFELIADGSWHEYSFELVPGEVFDPGSDHITICLTGHALCDQTGATCPGETENYYDDFRIERMGAIPNESKSWGRVKALFH
jgi:hypothetical protein